VRFPVVCSTREEICFRIWSASRSLIAKAHNWVALDLRTVYSEEP
jgi:hypothetical protein